jgi:hypothetical protein
MRAAMPSVPRRLRSTAGEREQLVRWWIEQSGLSGHEIQRIAAAIWGEAPPSRVVAVGGRSLRGAGRW